MFVILPPTVHAHFSVSFLCLHSTVLCLSPGARTRAFALEKCCPTSTQPLLQLHLVLSHNNPWLLSTILGCYYQQPMVGFTAKQLSYLGHAHQPLYLLGFYSIADCLPPFSHDLFTSTLLNNGISLLSLGLLGMGKPVYLTAFMYLNQFLPGLGRCRKRRSTLTFRKGLKDRKICFFPQRC